MASGELCILSEIGKFVRPTCMGSGLPPCDPDVGAELVGVINSVGLAERKKVPRNIRSCLTFMSLNAEIDPGGQLDYSIQCGWKFRPNCAEKRHSRPRICNHYAGP